jgi:TolA-binding protein
MGNGFAEKCLAVFGVLMLLLLVSCDSRLWPDPVREKQEKQAQVTAGRDNEGLKLRVDDLDHRMKDDATALDKRLRELERRIERLEQGLPPVRQ